MSKFNLLEDLLGERKRVHEFSKPELQKAGKKVFQKLKRNLATSMTKATVVGNVEDAMAKELGAKTFELKGRANSLVPIQDVIQDVASDVHDLVVKLRKKSGKSFANINESR